jgi:COX assembly mitochondrial protein 1
MNALSRREEDTLMKTTKARALRECDPIVKGIIATPVLEHSFTDSTGTIEFADCATGRTVSVAWVCKDKYKAVQECISQ